MKSLGSLVHAALSLAILLSGCVSLAQTDNRGLNYSQMVDLTHTLTPDFPYIPVDGITYPFEIHPIATLAENQVAANEWKIHEHLGTQIDAPSHFIGDGISLDQLEIVDLIVPAVVIDISERASRDPDAELTVEDILAWENEHGPLPANACVFMYSGWEERIGDPSYIGLDGTGTMHFPGISRQAAEFLVSERDIAGVGVDVLSIDPGWDDTFQTHLVILAAGKWAVEGVANLSQIPPVGALVFVGAPKVGGATGGPVRLIAVW